MEPQHPHGTPSSDHESLYRVVLADDHQLVRSGIGFLLASLPGVEVLAGASNGQELVELADRLRPDLVMTDISMPGIDGFEAMAIIHDQQPQIGIAVLSMHDEIDIVRRAIACGARAYIRKDSSLMELGHALERIRSRGGYFSAGIAHKLLLPATPTAHEMLSHRQLEVLALLARSLSSKEIALHLRISPKTVDVHRARIMETLHLRNVASLTRYALRNGLVKLGSSCDLK